MLKAAESVLEARDFLKGRGKPESWPLLFCPFLSPSVLGLLFPHQSLTELPAGQGRPPVRLGTFSPAQSLPGLALQHIAAAENDNDTQCFMTVGKASSCGQSRVCSVI